MGAGNPGDQLDGWPCSLEGRRCRAPTQLGRPWVGGADLRFVSFCGSRFGFRMEEDGRCSGRQCDWMGTSCAGTEVRALVREECQSLGRENPLTPVRDTSNRPALVDRICHLPHVCFQR